MKPAILCLVLLLLCHTCCDGFKVALKIKKLINKKHMTLIPVIKTTFGIYSAKCAAVNYPKKLLLQSMIKTSKLQMKLYTDNGFMNYTMDTALEKLTVNNSLFNPQAKTLIYLHGFKGEPISDDIHTIGRQVKKYKGYNMLTMDNTKYFNVVSYTLAAGFAPPIGEILADFISGLAQKGLPIKKLYLVGHGLGAQLAGLTSKKCQSKYGLKMGRITALDPAVPCTLKTEKALNRDDANYVDVIHTSTYSFRGNSTGHADYYVNNWLGKQPGCFGDIKCSHARAISLYAESTKNLIAFFAKKCKIVIKYKCKIYKISLMGFPSSPITKGDYILKTKRSSPYSKGMFGLLL